MRSSSETSYQAPGIVPPVNSAASSRVSLVIHGPGPHDHLDGVSSEDITIAHGLLAGNEPRLPPRRSSFDRSSSIKYCPVLYGNQSSGPGIMNPANRRSRHNSTSNTWSSSNGGEVSETDEIDDRTAFVQEYNKIATQYGISALVRDSYEAVSYDKEAITGKHGSWLMKRILKRTSSMLAVNKSKLNLKHRRSVSDFSLRRTATKKNGFKDKHLAELVRLCGSCPFYLPTEYAAGTLNLPTCFRATAQYLVQRGPTVRGIFRISGSHTTVADLYNHYASQDEDEDGDVISGTVRCPTLPDSIQCDEHDVASVFKKFLSGLPGGILGNMWLFEALVSIHNQLGTDPEWTKTRQSKVRARMIACAISAHPSRFQRDLICAVFGLLCMIGRASETTLREDDHGRPLPTHGLMGYSQLGTIFGPLLLGDLIEEYDTHRRELKAESMPGKISPRRKSKHKKTKSAEESLLESRLASDKLKVANRIAEMLITHWRDVIRHMKNLGSMTSSVIQQRRIQEHDTISLMPLLRPSVSESLFLRQPPEWEEEQQSIRFIERGGSPILSSRNPLKFGRTEMHCQPLEETSDDKQIKRQRSRPKTAPGQILSGVSSMSILTPQTEDTDKVQYEQLDSKIMEDRARSNAEYSVPTVETISSNPFLHRKLRSCLKTSMEKDMLVMDEARVSLPLTTDDSWSQSEKRNKFNEEQKIDDAQLLQHDLRQLASEDKSTNATVTAKGLQPQSTEGGEIPVTKEIGESLSSAEKQCAEKEQLPGIRRFTDQSPSENLERILSSRISQDAIVRRFVGHRATDPGHFPSGSRSLFKASEEYPRHQNREASLILGHGGSHFSKDPLKRVSHEEDMASLASLAQVILSEDDGDNKSLATSDLNAYSNLPLGSSNNIRAEKDSGTSPQSYLNKYKKPDATNTSESPALNAVESMSKALGGLPLHSPSTPRRPRTDPATSARNGMGTVKFLAAKFDTAEQEIFSKSPASPSKLTPLARDKFALPAQGSILSTYTINPSPQYPSRNSAKSNRSFQAVCNKMFQDRNATSPQTTPTKSGLPVFHPKSASLMHVSGPTTTSPGWATVRHAAKRSQDNGNFGLTTGPMKALFQVSENLQTSGDGGKSLGMPLQPSIGKVLPRPTEPPVALHMNLSRPRSTSITSDLQSLNDRRLLHGSSEMGFHGRGTSMLYSQITNLQKLLETRTEEVDNLRRQLATKGSLNDLGTLSEQLREAKREAMSWQKRALMAEMRLERLSQLAPMCKNDANGDGASILDSKNAKPDKSDAVARSVHDSQIMDGIKTMLHSGMDGATSSEESAGSEGTIRRRIIIESSQVSKEDLICLGSGEELLLDLALEPVLDSKAHATHAQELYELA